MASGMGSAGARLGAGLQVVAAIAALFITSAVLGTWVVPTLPADLRTPVLALAMWGAVAAGAIMLAVSGTSYPAIGLARPKSLLNCLLWAIGAVAVAEAGAVVLGEVIHRTTGWPPIDVGYIRNAVRGNPAAFATWIVLVVWGSAAFGEELFARGFVLDRLQAVFGRNALGTTLAVAGQAILFGLLHAIQGPTGIVVTLWVGLVLAGVYLASGRNLWAPILAHGLMDSAALTLMFLDQPLPGFIH